MAKVVGQVWATKRLDELPQGALVEIQRLPAGAREVAWDPIGCCEGERVLYVTGGSAVKGHKKQSPMCECLIVAVLDDDSPGGAVLKDN
jgi:ethanolamine utilization protein EutN